MINNEVIMKLKEMLLFLKCLQEDGRGYSKEIKLATTRIDNLNAEIYTEDNNIINQQKLIRDYKKSQRNYKYALFKDIIGIIISLVVLFGCIPLINTHMSALSVFASLVTGLFTGGVMVYLWKKTKMVKEALDAIRFRYYYLKPSSSIEASKLKISELKMKRKSLERDLENYLDLQKCNDSQIVKKKEAIISFVLSGKNMQNIQDYSFRYCSPEVQECVSKLMRKLDKRKNK